MPVLKHARKKLRQDKKRTLRNKRVRELYKSFVKKAKANPTPEALAQAFSSIDKAAKQNIIHENKAARLKSSLTKGSGGAEGSKEPKEAKTGSPKKVSVTKKAAKKATKKAGK
jgi:small subunit ribosomal protein S20